MKKSTIAVAVAATTGIATADAASITSMTVTSGYFGHSLFSFNLPFSGIGSDNDLAVYSTFSGNNTQQATGSGGICAEGVIACFDYGYAQANTFLAPSAQTGVPGGGPTLSGQAYDATGGTTAIDTSGFFMNWDGVDFGQGNVNATLTTFNCVDSTCDFTATWTSPFVNGPFDNTTGSWIISGQLSGVASAAVPVPGAAWLMGSGLVGLVRMALRKSKRSQPAMTAI